MSPCQRLVEGRGCQGFVTVTYETCAEPETRRPTGATHAVRAWLWGPRAVGSRVGPARVAGPIPSTSSAGRSLIRLHLAISPYTRDGPIAIRSGSRRVVAP